MPVVALNLIQLKQNVKQADGIRPSRYAHNAPFFRPQQALSADELADAPDELVPALAPG